MYAISAQDLKKQYGRVHAVRGATFSVDTGEVVAILGPNGAGKTTIVEILEGYRTRSGGSVSVLGCDPQSAGSAFRQRIGILPQSTTLYEELRTEETLRLFAGYYERPQPVPQMLELVGLTHKSGARVKTLSGGQRRRLDLAVALIGNPEVLFLDEPTTGFDPEARREAWSLIHSLATQGRTVLMTTHYLEEAERLANRVVILFAGRVLAQGNPKSMQSAHLPTTVSFDAPDQSSTSDIQLSHGEKVEIRNGKVSIVTMDPSSSLAVLSEWARTGGHELSGLRVESPTLEEVYLHLLRNAQNQAGDRSESPS